MMGEIKLTFNPINADIADEDEEYDEDYDDDDYLEESENQTDKAPDKWMERLNVTELAEKVREVFSEKSVESTGGEILDGEDGDSGGEVPAQECPMECSCLPHSFVDCSQRNLTQIPENLPQNTSFIDLSHNSITTLHIDDFSNATHLRDIRLHDNQIGSIDKMAFAQLDRLDSVDLSYNQLKHIVPDTFAHSLHVTKVNLSGNPLEIPTDAPLLNSSSLEELDLSACNISNLYLDTFTNLSGLVALNINNNPIDEELNVDVFKPLEHLQHFQSVAISQDNIPDLCDNLASIDEIRFPTFILSCFELASGSTFEESIATHPPSTVSPPPTTTTPYIPTTTTTKSTTSKSSQLTTTSTVAPEIQQHINSMSSGIRSTTVNNSTESSNTTATTEDPDSVETSAKGIDSRGVVELSAETINNILIGIIIIAVIGLAIGVIFRRDCCGIKTKMCRTRTRRPAPTDQVRPAEEVPLNKIG
uniref:Uncharacterized protein n=1 Tax=Phlebotomus papatasi TaxID=29031 RepID=A0A1B0D309_PHLPP